MYLCILLCVYVWVVGCWLQPVTSVIIENTKHTKNTKPNYKKCHTEGGKIINKREIQHTLVDSRFCSLTACLKNEKYKRTKCNLWRNGKIQKKYKNTKCIFGSNGKYNKSTKIQSVFFVIWQKMQNKYECNLKHTTKYEPKVSNIQNTKKSTNSNMNQRANPMFILKSKNPLAK